MPKITMPRAGAEGCMAMWNSRYLRIDADRNSKFTYYLQNVLAYPLPGVLFRPRRDALLEKGKTDREVQERLHYYNRCDAAFRLGSEAQSLDAFRKVKKKTYFFDLYGWWRYFRPECRSAYLFGDITHVPPQPTLVKSRPIAGDNRNSVLMNLNKVRHFVFVNDALPFEAKKNMAVWRGKAYGKHRRAFVKRFYNHPRCDIGQTNTKFETEVPWQKGRMTLKEQLRYKFVISIEGNDVASNLKWIMSSNSLALMARPKYETWFMEGTLIPDYHYVLLKDDYSDLEEKIAYYSAHPEEAKAIIANAHRHVARFRDAEREAVVSLSVMEKYFERSGQLEAGTPHPRRRSRPAWRLKRPRLAALGI
ncbi:glycosyl transferase family 90 [Sulfurimonas sp. HSL1-6]|uniref:glycosyl transferase family 90 n=1 Tax=Thiomicrolovo immobilis TaxID=3131935 RepID=UPI0031F87805